MPSQVVKVPLSYEAYDSVTRFCTPTDRSPADYITDALFLGVTLESQNISDGLNSFKVNGDEYAPPGFQAVYPDDTVTLVKLEARDHLLARKHALTKHGMRLKIYMAHCTLLMNDMRSFGIEEPASVTRGGSGFEIVSLIPFEWDGLHPRD